MLERTLSLKPPISLWTTEGDAFLHPHVYSKKCSEFSQQIIHKTHGGRTPHTYACNISYCKNGPGLPSKSGCAVSEVTNKPSSWSRLPGLAQCLGRPSKCHTSRGNGWLEQEGLQTTLPLPQRHNQWNCIAETCHSHLLNDFFNLWHLLHCKY